MNNYDATLGNNSSRRSKLDALPASRPVSLDFCRFSADA